MLASFLRHLLITKPLRTGPNTPEYSLRLRAVRLLLPPLNPTRTPKWSVASNPAAFSFPEMSFSVTDLLLGSSERPLPLSCSETVIPNSRQGEGTTYQRPDTTTTLIGRSDGRNLVWANQTRVLTTDTSTETKAQPQPRAERNYTALFNFWTFFWMIHRILDL